MSETLLKNYLHQLIECWSNANFRYDLIEKAQQKTVISLFSTHQMYQFSDYAKSNTWASEDWLQAGKPDNHFFCEYCYDADNIPVLVKKYYNGIIANIGALVWTETLWEYIEFNVLNLVCSAYYSLSFKDGKKELFKSLRLNGGVFQGGVDNMSAAAMALQLAGDPYGYMAEVNSYNYDHDIIRTADSLSNFPGIGEYFTTDYYSYDSRGELYKITAFNSKKEEQIVYIVLSDRSVEELIQYLSRQMADYLTVCVVQSGYKQKLSCIILNYKYCYSYWPCLSLIAEAEMSDAVKNKEEIFPMGQFYSNADFHTEAPEKLLDDFAELEQHISQKDKHELGERLLLETSKIMTASCLQDLIPVSKDFLVFPIDWTLHDPPEEELLKACGASATQIKLWRKLRWLTK